MWKKSFIKNFLSVSIRSKEQVGKEFPLEEIANRYELDLDDAWNKDLLPHQGRHPNAYHEYVLDSMKQFDNIAQGDKDIFLKLFDNLKNNVKSNPDMLYKDYWK